MGLTYAHRSFSPGTDAQPPLAASVPAAAATATAVTGAVTQIWTTQHERSVGGQYETSNERGGVVPAVRMQEVQVEVEGAEAA